MLLGAHMLVNREQVIYCKEYNIQQNKGGETRKFSPQQNM